MSLQRDIHCDTLSCHKVDIGGLLIVGGSIKQDFWSGISPAGLTVTTADSAALLPFTEVSKSGSSISQTDGNTITFNTAGIYMVHFQGYFPGSSTSGIRQIWIFSPSWVKIYGGGESNPSHGTFSLLNAYAVIHATAGGQVQFQAYQTSGIDIPFSPQAGPTDSNINIVRLA